MELLILAWLILDINIIHMGCYYSYGLLFTFLKKGLIIFLVGGTRENMEESKLLFILARGDGGRESN
jgi:hypothetical protein